MFTSKTPGALRRPQHSLLEPTCTYPSPLMNPTTPNPTPKKPPGPGLEPTTTRSTVGAQYHYAISAPALHLYRSTTQSGTPKFRISFKTQFRANSFEIVKFTWKENDPRKNYFKRPHKMSPTKVELSVTPFRQTDTHTRGKLLFTYTFN